jgi:hypothetical protein
VVIVEIVTFPVMTLKMEAACSSKTFFPIHDYIVSQPRTPQFEKTFTVINLKHWIIKFNFLYLLWCYSNHFPHCMKPEGSFPYLVGSATITYYHMLGCMTYKMGFGLDDWIYLHLIHSHSLGLQAMQHYR